MAETKAQLLKLLETMDEYIAQAKMGMQKNHEQIEELRKDLIERGYGEALEEIEGVIEITGHHGQALGRLTMAGMVRGELQKILSEMEQTK
jgi:hypothetical protein